MRLYALKSDHIYWPHNLEYASIGGCAFYVFRYTPQSSIFTVPSGFISTVRTHTAPSFRLSAPFQESHSQPLPRDIV